MVWQVHLRSIFDFSQLVLQTDHTDHISLYILIFHIPAVMVGKLPGQGLIAMEPRFVIYANVYITIAPPMEYGVTKHVVTKNNNT